MLTWIWMEIPGQTKIQNAGLSALAHGNPCLGLDAHIWLEKNKKCRSISSGTWMDAPGQTKIKIAGPLTLAFDAKKSFWKHIYAVNITMDPTVWSLLWALPQQRNFLFWLWNAINYCSVMVCAEDPKDSHYTLTFTNR